MQNGFFSTAKNDVLEVYEWLDDILAFEALFGQRDNSKFCQKKGHK